MSSWTAERALASASLRYGSRAHVIEEGRRTTFSGLDEAATEMARRLREAGLRDGRIVALEVGNTAAHLAAIFGIWRSGGVLVPLNPKLGAEEIEGIATRAGAQLHVRVRFGSGELEIASGAGDAKTADPELAAIAYTSGTTGRPKGVEITHEALLWSAVAVMQTRRDDASAVAAMVSPICHLPVLVSHYLARLLSGGTVVADRFDPDRLAILLEMHGVTDLPLVPAMVAPLVERVSAAAASRLRKVSVGSAATPMDIKEALAVRFPKAEILEAYGQTESTDGLTMTIGREALDRPGTVGRPHAIVVMGVVDPAGHRLGAGETGELVCQGPTLMRGYRDDPEATDAALRNGWLHTGDLGRIDDDGYVYVTGRLKEIIISGGENVSPEEVEAVLREHPAVLEAGVFGRAHPRWGEEVVAAVVCREPVDERALLEHVGRRLARFKRPGRVFFVDALPRTSAGKLRRRALRDRFAAG